jgi:hypothetical protein
VGGDASPTLSIAGYPAYYEPQGADWLRDSSVFTHMALAPSAKPEWGTAAVIILLGVDYFSNLDTARLESHHVHCLEQLATKSRSLPLGV